MALSMTSTVLVQQERLHGYGGSIQIHISIGLFREVDKLLIEL